MMSLIEPFLVDLGVRSRRPRPAGCVVKLHSLEALSGIHERDTAMVIGERRLPAPLAPWLAAWAPHAPHVDTKVDVGEDLSPVLLGLPPGPMRDWFHTDLQELVVSFGRVAGVRRFRLVAGPVRNDSCRRFHVDHLRLRMITTYLGPGTEWVDQDNVDFTALDHPESCDCDNPPSLVRDEGKIQRATAGDVLLMKGDLYSNDVRGQVHRSPPIDGTGVVRHVVVLTLPGRSAPPFT